MIDGFSHMQQGRTINKKMKQKISFKEPLTIPNSPLLPVACSLLELSLTQRRRENTNMINIILIANPIMVIIRFKLELIIASIEILSSKTMHSCSVSHSLSCSASLA
jgi:hypothetical protein